MLVAGFGDGPRPVGSWLGACALPWIAVCGLPRRSSDEAPLAGAARELAALLPVLTLASILDLQRGVPGADLVRSGAVLALLGAGLRAAATRRRPAPGLDLVWLLVVLALPLLAATLAWNDGPGGGVEWLTQLARVSPAHLAYEHAAGGARPGLLAAAGPAACVLVLLGWAQAARRSA